MASFNLIQAPEILLRLSRALGLRQAHVTPTLNEGVQAVVLIADVSRDPSAPIVQAYRSGAFSTVAAGLLFHSFNLCNPVGSGVRVRIISIEWSARITTGTQIGVGPRFFVLPTSFSRATNPLDPSGSGRSKASPIFQEGAGVSAPNDWLDEPVSLTPFPRIMRPREMVLPPGLTVGVGNRGAVNIGDTFGWAFEWQEEHLPNA
jgi:hypothetical protein